MLGSTLEAMMKVKQIVARDLYFVEPSHTVAEVARQMVQLRVGAIVVLDGRRLCGVFSERDLMTRVVLERLDPEATPVSDVMTTEVVTIDESEGMELAMESMRANECRHLPVLSGDEVVGFLSMRDLMHIELARKTEELHRMRAYVHGIA
jgi:CBS domain-containing protein